MTSPELTERLTNSLLRITVKSLKTENNRLRELVQKLQSNIDKRTVEDIDKFNKCVCAEQKHVRNNAGPGLICLNCAGRSEL